MRKYFIILKEFGLKWAIYRSIYGLKLKTLNVFPSLDKFFEKKVQLKRLDLLEFDTELLEDFLTNLPLNEQNKIIDSADNALNGKIRGFSSINLDYGYPIDWHLNPITNKTHDKNKKWFEIPDFDKDIGDIKVIWEISRFTHFIDFTRAYMITKDIKYYEGYINQLDDWLKENKYSYGPNYKCGQEATIRMVNVLIGYSIFNEYNLVSKSDELLVKELVENSYKKVYSNFFYAHKCIKNNHTFTEILGKIIGAWSENDTVNLKKSMKLMGHEIETQLTEDGGFTQYSNNYHRFILQILEVLLKIETKLDIKVSNKEKIYRSNMILYNMMNKDGYLPNYGSNDGALIFPLSNSDFRDYRPTVGAIHGLLKNESLFNEGMYDEEVIWFTNSIPKREVKQQEALNLKDIGQYSFRDDDSFLLVHLNDLKYRPAHMDQLHIDLWYQGEEIFADLGTYSYASDLGYKLSLNENHNTVSVPNKSQMNKTGAFMTFNRSKILDVTYDLNKVFKGSLYSQNGYIHIRQIIKTETGFEIIDEVDQTNYLIIFNTPLEVKINNNVILLSKNKKVFIKLITNEEIELKKQFRSLYYFKKDTINQIIIKVKQKEKTKTEIVLVGKEND